MSDDAVNGDASQDTPSKRRCRPRIAMSIFFAVLTLLWSVSWFASYWTFTVGHGILPGRVSFAFTSLDGAITVTFTRASQSWGLKVWDATQFPAMRTFRDRSLNYTFRMSKNSSALTVQTPLWFPSLVCGIGAGLAWIQIRFSLRTLLVVMSVLAIVLALAVHAGR